MHLDVEHIIEEEKVSSLSKLQTSTTQDRELREYFVSRIKFEWQLSLKNILASKESDMRLVRWFVLTVAFLSMLWIHYLLRKL